MRILIHALAVRRHGGTARHLMNFIPALGKYGTDNQYLLYVDQDAYLPSVPSNVMVYRESVRASWRRVLWDVRRLPTIAKQERVDAVWNLLGFGMLDTKTPQIMFQRAPGYYCHHYLTAVEKNTRREAALRRWWQAVIMRRSAHIITPTAAMREMIRHHHPDLPLSQFSVVPHAFNPAALEGELTADIQQHLAALPAKAVKLLYVGHILPYKDLLFMLDVFAEAQKKADKPLYWFLTIAAQDWASGYEAFMAKRRDKQLEDHVIVLGKLSGSVVGTLYKRCNIILFTSLCESFGWPMLEATSLSKPLLAVDTPLNREMIGPGALYYTYQDHSGAVNQLLELVSDKQKQTELGQAGYQYFEKTHFDWQKYVANCHHITQKALTRQKE